MFKTNEKDEIIYTCLGCGHEGPESEFWFEVDGERGEECPKCGYMGVRPADKRSPYTVKRDFSCGFSLWLDSEVGLDNAKEDGFNVDSIDWAEFAEDALRVERRIVEFIRNKYGLTMRDEGHDSTGDLLGSCWIPMVDDDQAIEGTDRCWLTEGQGKAFELLMTMQGTDRALDFMNSYDGDFGDYEELFKDCGEFASKYLEASLHFFDQGKDEIELFEDRRIELRRLEREKEKVGTE